MGHVANLIAGSEAVATAPPVFTLRVAFIPEELFVREPRARELMGGIGHKAFVEIRGQYPEVLKLLPGNVYSVAAIQYVALQEVLAQQRHDQNEEAKRQRRRRW